MAARSLIAVLLALFASASTIQADELARVAALEDLEISGEVAGDVVALGGDVHLSADARVHGDVVVLLGTVERDPGAEVDGRVLAVTSLASLQVDERADGGTSALLDAAVRILSSGGWLLVTTVLAFGLPARMRAGGRMARDLGVRTLVLGLVAWLTLFVALVASLGLGPALGPPMAVLVMLGFFAVKALGLTALGGVVGQLATRRGGARRWPLTYTVFGGVAVLLLLRVVPVVGGAVWTLASLFALGAGVMTLAVGDPTTRLGELLRQPS